MVRTAPIATAAATAALVAAATYWLWRRRRRARPPLPYHIGRPGVPWSEAEKQRWRAETTLQRSYRDLVLARLVKSVPEAFVLESYGALSHDPQRYPLYAARTRQWSRTKPSVLITGGVHGYETSGVMGTIRFLQSDAEAYSGTFNIVIAPCVSPWGFEAVQRWNIDAVDPNRSFAPNGPHVEGRPFNPEAATEESTALIRHLEGLGVEQWLMHIDCHETTDSDAFEFGPARQARNGKPPAFVYIPDGFFIAAAGLVDGYEGEGSGRGAELAAWHRAIIDGVRKVTHIAPAGPDGTIEEGMPDIQEGVVGIPTASELGLCTGVTNARFAVTTEVYPDSPKTDDEQCNRAQVATITSALDHLIASGWGRAVPAA